jgi:hypothetical protein
LKRELEAIDDYIESKRTGEFKAELRAFLLDETVAEWRSGDVQKQALVNKLHSITVDTGIIPLYDKNTFTSGVVDTNVITTGAERQYDESAGGYLYIKRIAEHMAKSDDIDRDIASRVLEMSTAIDRSKTSQLCRRQK